MRFGGGKIIKCGQRRTSVNVRLGGLGPVRIGEVVFAEDHGVHVVEDFRALLLLFFVWGPTIFFF